MTAYQWTCHLCKAENPAGRTTCEKCEFPAEATAEEIALAQSTGSLNAVLEQRSQKTKARADWKAQPLWVKASVVVGVLVITLGVVLARFAPPLEYNLLGVVITRGRSRGLRDRSQMAAPKVTSVLTCSWCGPAIGAAALRKPVLAGRTARR
jgi:hypothetical protein